MLYLGKGIRGCHGGLAATAFRSRLRQCLSPRGCCLWALFPNCRLGLSVPLVSLIGNGLFSRSSRLSTLLPCLQRMRAAFLLVLQAGKCGLTLQSPRGLASKPGKEVLAVEPQEDDSGGRRLPCLSGASATSSLLVKEALATCSLLTFKGGALVKKTLSGTTGLLVGSLLLVSTSSVLVEEPLAAGTTVEMVYVDNDALVSDQPCICASLCLSTISEGAQSLLMYKIDLECSLKLLRASTQV